MLQFLLDTDHLTLVGHGHAELVLHVREGPETSEDHPGSDPPDQAIAASPA